MVKMQKTMILLIFLILMVLCSGCGRGGTLAQEREVLATVGEVEDILIGVAWPFETNNSLFREGVELAAAEINAGGGINGRLIRLLMKDDQASVTRGMAVAQSFAENTAVVAVIGHRSSTISIPASTIYEDAGLLMLSPASTAPRLTQRGYKNIFRNIPSDDEIAKQLASFALEQGHQRMVIYYVDTPYGLGLANSFEDHAQELGIMIVDRITHYGGLKSLDRLHQKWQALAFDGVFLAQVLPGGAEFIADAGYLGFEVPFIGGNALDSPLLGRIGGKSAEGTVIGTIFNPADPRDKVQTFIDSFYKKHQIMPSAYTAQGYDALKLLAAAIEKAGVPATARIAEALRAFNNQPGVAGYHIFAENGDAVGDLVVLKVVQGGELKVLK